MVEVCSEGQYWDGLIKKCISCQMVCRQTQHVVRCTDYCVSQQCKSVSGQYYDRLLKKCLRCAEVCGSHPSVCSQHCQTQAPVLSPGQKPVEYPVLQTPTSRGHSPPRSLPHSATLMYSLLGLCLVLLLCTLSLALVVVLRRTRAKTRPSRPRVTVKGDAQIREGQVGQEPNQHGLSSKDCLMEPGVSRLNALPSPRSPSPTETCECVHCFPDFRTAPPGVDHQRPPAQSFYQQAVPQPPQPPNGAPCWEQGRHLYPRIQAEGHGVGVFPRGPGDKSGALRIICSPSHHSM